MSSSDSDSDDDGRSHSRFVASNGVKPKFKLVRDPETGAVMANHKVEFTTKEDLLAQYAAAHEIFEARERRTSVSGSSASRAKRSKRGRDREADRCRKRKERRKRRDKLRRARPQPYEISTHEGNLGGIKAMNVDAMSAIIWCDHLGYDFAKNGKMVPCITFAGKKRPVTDLIPERLHQIEMERSRSAVTGSTYPEALNTEIKREYHDIEYVAHLRNKPEERTTNKRRTKKKKKKKRDDDDDDDDDDRRPTRKRARHGSDSEGGGDATAFGVYGEDADVDAPALPGTTKHAPGRAAASRLGLFDPIAVGAQLPGSWRRKQASFPVDVAALSGNGGHGHNRSDAGSVGSMDAATAGPVLGGGGDNSRGGGPFGGTHTHTHGVDPSGAEDDGFLDGLDAYVPDKALDDADAPMLDLGTAHLPGGGDGIGF
jgi:hypothetical protein